MADDTGHYALCPLCGFEFDREDTLCRHGCPLSTLCNLVRCPSCSYEFPARGKERRPRSFLARLFGRRRAPASRPLEEVVTVGQLEKGERVQVVALSCESSSRSNALTVFGLVPGSEITLLERRPTFVIRVGETELAFDADIAREILVRPLPDAA